MRESSPPTRSVESPGSRSYGVFLRRHRQLLVVALVLGALIGTVLFFGQPGVSTAVTTIVVTPQEVSPGVDLERPNLISLDSDAQVLTSVRVLGRAAQATGFPGGIEALERETVVSAIADSRVLVVRVSDVRPELAVAAAAAIADEFLRVRADAANVRGEAARARLEEQVGSVSDRLVALRAPASASAGVLLTGELIEEQELTDTLSELQAELARTVTGAADPGRIVLPATVLGPPGRPMGLATLASGALLGAVVGLGAGSIADQVLALRRSRWPARD